MLTLPAPGHQPQNLLFNLSMLLTEQGIEYSIQEAHAKSMGLLRKKWDPPPPSKLPPSTVSVDFNEYNSKAVAQSMRRKSVTLKYEPTITINTKEALAGVFRMYNSPKRL